MARLAESRTILWLSAALVVAAHAVVLFAWSPPPQTPGVLMEEDSPGVEVELVASADEVSEEVPAPAEETPPPPPEPVEQPTPEPTPIPEEPPPQEETPEVLPEATPQATPPPKPPSPKPPTPKPKKSTAPPVVKPSSSSAQFAGPAGSGSPQASQASFAKRPSLIYPVESRQAREEGTVLLRITVDSRGRPTNVTVIKSSGFSRLDRAAIEGAWRCRIRNAKAGTTLDVPLRFDLDE